MPKPIKRTRDENALAKSVVDSILEELEEEPKPVKEKDPQAVKRGQRGGAKGGKARAQKLSAKERSAIAKKAAKTRWDKTQPL
jgi:hypothetical protein